MPRRFAVAAAAVLAVSLLAADTAAAQQTLNFSLGYFTIRPEGSRVDGDVLLENHDVYLFDFSDFNTVSIGAEYLAPIGNYLEVGGGIAFSSRSVDTIYAVDRPGGVEIDQQLRLRVVPMTATLRLLLLGQGAAVQPYVGGGIGLFNWRYEETGDFIDFTQPGLPIFSDTYTASGTAVGPVAVFGVRAAGTRASIGGEIRYQRAEGDLDLRDFFGPRIDLGGLTYNVTFGIRF